MGWSVLILLLLSRIVMVFCKRYDIVPPWNFNLNSAPIVYTTSSSSVPSFGYTLASNGSAEIVSENGTFALAFLMGNSTTVFNIGSRRHGMTGSYSTGPTMIAVVMQKRFKSGVSAVPVWESELGTSFGSLNSLSSVNSVEMNESGNLALYVDDSLVWQSFDHPGDILLPGQRLRTGMRLISHGDYFDEDYVAEVANSGFVLYVVEFYYSSQPQLSNDSLAYGLWSLGNSQESSTIFSAQMQLCQGYEAVLDFTGSEVKLVYEANSTKATTCNVSALSLPLRSFNLIMQLPYVQLTSKGDLVIYNYDSGAWSVVAKISDNLGHCKLPSACELDKLDWTSPMVSVCDSNNNQCTEVKPETLGHAFYKVDGVNHFATKFMTGTHLEMGACYGPEVIYDNNTKLCYRFSFTQRRRYYRDNTTHDMTAFYLTYQSRFGGVRYFMLNILRIYVMRSALIWLLAIPASLVIKYEVPGMVERKLAVMKYNITNRLNSYSKAVKETEALLSTMQGLPCRYKYLELESATKRFSTKLGAGGFGSVYKGTTTDGKHIAVKVLFGAHAKQITKQFVTEIVGIGGVSHFNIVKLYGFCIDGATKRLLVYEFMPNGSLDSWIFNKEKSLNWQQRLDIALGTARALCYLHEECSEPILHLDVKPQNILLDENFVPKVSDFGVAKLLENRDMSHATTTVRGTVRYMAPEWLMNSVATKKCDVYSFGLVLLEIIGGRRNTDWLKLSEGEDEDSTWFFPSWVVKQVRRKNVFEIWDEKVRSSAVEHERQATEIVHLALWCIQNSPSLRPSFSEIVDVLEGQRSIEEPPMSFRFNVGSQNSFVEVSSTT